MASGDVKDVIVYPQNLPNAAPEQWIAQRPDLDRVCSHDSICGWVSSSASGRGLRFQELEGQGVGGLDAHVSALNADRRERGLTDVEALHVDPWPMAACSASLMHNNILFLDDEAYEAQDNDSGGGGGHANGTRDGPNTGEDDGISGLLGGARISATSLYGSVAVGGTFDGMHYGHRKLLTLAVSSVQPQTAHRCDGRQDAPPQDTRGTYPDTGGTHRGSSEFRP